jgi:serine/threonine protein kinase
VRFGRYVLIDRLGFGGMAEVFRALAVGAEQFQSVVVVKRILAHLGSNPAFIKMFIDEAKLCGQLSHPNVIRVHDFGKQEGQYFLAMEYVQGRNLGLIIHRLGERRERMPPMIAAEIARQAARGLAYAHSLTASDGKPLGIIHRDISPGNVMVAYSGLVKLLDFGVARVENRFRKSLTDPGHLKGKAGYLAPEQLTAQGFDHRADIFSMGILLHEMLTGHRLFRGASPTETMMKIKSMPIVAPSQSNPAVPAHLDDIVMRALQRTPADRYQTASALADDLEALLLEARASSAEVPRFMQTFFEEDSHGERLDLSREDIQELIRRADKSGSLPAVVPKAAATDPEAAATLAMLDQWPEPEPEEVAPPAHGHRLVAVAGVLVAAMAALAVGRFFRDGHVKPGPGAKAGSPAAAIAPTEIPRTAVTGAATPAPQAARLLADVKISISSEPAGATVTRGAATAATGTGPDQGPALGVTPLDLAFPKSTAPLWFRITKTGYVEGLLKIVPDGDKPALVTLAKAAASRSALSPTDPQSQNGKKVRNALPMDPFSQ